MKKDEVENMLNSMNIPEPENIMSHGDLKIPLLSFKRSSRAGLWLLIVPVTFAITVLLKTEFGLTPGYLNFIHKFFAAINNNNVLTYLIPMIFIGLPLLAMILNFLAICHFQRNKKMKELIVTIKYRPLNIVIFLFSFAILIFFLLPDKLAF
ncbi:MAG: hypothetical protein JWQ09_4207 [Segetibacter sp.]|jgi:hypothetical protein|nr:hypothetical protein [Segetibacter sp.]